MSLSTTILGLSMLLQGQLHCHTVAIDVWVFQSVLLALAKYMLVQ